ncbi:hypothetical protein [Agaribacterium sp. ZY112]|uniref:hypothetical protein n=1 Tax=Agaribacterium sp. ZY112 TaxID=3233574 RepID=UPI0035247814
MVPQPHSIHISKLRAISGFSLVEILAVMLVLVALAVVAIPKFVELSSASRNSALEVINGAAQSANALVKAKVYGGADTREVPSRDDLLDVDMTGDGNYDTRLKWGWLDNTDIHKWINLSDDFGRNTQGIDKTFIGYDLDNNGTVINDRCYFLYTQASGAGRSPGYEVVADGC